MKFRDHFVLAARIVGLLVALSGLQTLVTLIFILFGGAADLFLIVYFGGFALFDLLLGAYLLRGAPHVVRFAFRGETGDVKIDLP